MKGLARVDGTLADVVSSLASHATCYDHPVAELARRGQARAHRGLRDASFR
jgi:hypothetical protein